MDRMCCSTYKLAIKVQVKRCSKYSVNARVTWVSLALLIQGRGQYEYIQSITRLGKLEVIDQE